MNLQFKERKGITLIALVITVIVLLILAGISISMLTGQNGIISQSGEARDKTIHANVLEQMQLEASAHTMDKATGDTSKTLIECLEDKSIITIIDEENEIWQINVTTLLGSKQSLGNGTYPNDVYILEKQSTSTGSVVNTEVATTVPIKIASTTTNQVIYKIVYYGSSINDSTNIGILMDNNSENTENIKSVNSRYILMENGKLYYLNDFIDSNGSNLYFNEENLNLTVFAENIKELLDGGGVGNICYVTEENELYRKGANYIESTLIEENIKKIVSIDNKEIYYINNDDTLYVCDFEHMVTVNKIAENVELADSIYYTTKDGKLYRSQYSYYSGVTNTEETENIDEIKDYLEKYEIYYDVNDDSNTSNYRNLSTHFETTSYSCGISFTKENGEWFYNTTVDYGGGVS